MKRLFSVAALAGASLLLVGCPTQQNTDAGGVKLSEREEIRYNNALAEVEECESLMVVCEQNTTNEQVVLLLTKARALQYNYNSEGMNSTTIEHCEALNKRIDKLQTEVEQFVENKMTSNGIVEIASAPNRLISEKVVTPVYLNAGEKVFYEMSASESVTFRFNNADTQRTLKNVVAKSIKDSVEIEYSGIYTFDVVPNGRCYNSLKVSVLPAESKGIYSRPKVVSETVVCNKGDWGATAVQTIKMHNIFEQPRQFTLRGQLKAAFSGNSKSVVAVPLPAGTTDILYSVRVATSEQSRSTDGEFHNNLTRSYEKIKMLGLPLYEKEKTQGVFMRLLDDNRPIREEDAYCNMYVFRSQSQAKQFQDGTKPASQLSYDVDYSAIGTQSCNGRIPTKDAKTIYLGFENERMRYVNYLWVEVVAAVPTTEYFTTKYTVQ